MTRLPFDSAVERSVLAEVGDPLHRLHALVDVGPQHFHDERHARIVEALRDGAPVSVEDHQYLDECIAYAWPLVDGAVERFLDLAARRQRALELEAELHELLEAV